ncbi:hypothetical protein CCL09_07100 [Pseudomonas congelans]|nr:hypothetical protein CCL09_07100 [Pseudomonas congelans]
MARWSWGTGCLSFLTLQRGNALGDAPRHRSAPHRAFWIARGTSRTALPRRSVVTRATGFVSMFRP